jgi:hypothetical protein
MPKNVPSPEGAAHSSPTNAKSVRRVGSPFQGWFRWTATVPRGMPWAFVVRPVGAVPIPDHQTPTRGVSEEIPRQRNAPSFRAERSAVAESIQDDVGSRGDSEIAELTPVIPRGAKRSRGIHPIGLEMTQTAPLPTGV